MTYFYSYLHFFTTLIYLFLTVFIFFKDYRSPLNLSCTAIFICMTIWSGAYIFIHHPATPENVMKLCENISSLGWIWFSLFFLIFFWIYSQRRITRKVMAIFAAFVAIPLILSYQQWAHEAIVTYHYRTSFGWMYKWNRTPWLYMFFGYYIVCILAGFGLTIDYHRKNEKTFSRRLSLILVGSGTVSLILGSLSNVILPLVMKRPPVPVAHVATLVWGITLAYVAIKYRLLDITPMIAARSIITVMKDLLFLLDPQGIIISVNQSTIHTLGYENHALTGMPFVDLIDSGDYLHKGFIERVVNVPIYSTETMLLGVDGNLIPVALSTSTIPNVGIVCVAYDITLQKQRTETLKETKKKLEYEVNSATAQLRKTNEMLEQEIAERKMAALALMETEQRFKVVFENAPDGIFLSDREGNFVDVNKETLRIIGYEKPEVIGRNIFKLGIVCSGRKDRDDRADVLKILDGESGTTELYIKNRAGERVPVEIATHPVTIGEYRLVLSMMRDLSLRKKMEEEKNELEQELHHAQKMDAVGRLAGGIAHDFNNLLAGIMGYAEMLEKKKNVGGAEEHSIVKKIVSTTQQASNLTAQLLAFARKGKYRAETVDIITVVDDVVDLLEHAVDGNVAIVKKIGTPSASVKGDRSQLQSALLNLGLNARDAMPEGGTITYAVFKRSEAMSGDADTEGEQGSSYVEVAVEDTGSGMDEQTLKKVFEPFFTTKPKGKGTGLGLASVYGTIKLHHGEIDVWSQPDKGTKITIKIPSTEANAVESAEIEEAPVTAVSGKSILVVDDEDIVREMVNDALTDFGHQVKACSDGNEALAWFSENGDACDLVLLDMTMPEINGVDCFRRIRKIKPEQKVVIFSGHAKGSDVDMLMSEGANVFLQKPVKLGVLEKTVNMVLST